MAGYKETPRQKMIAMMYLVLTAMLALNVSKEMLDAFIVVNESVELTNENFAQKLDDTYHAFDKKFKNDQNKVRPYRDKALQAKKISTQLVKYVDSLKYELISRTEGISVDSAKLVKVGNLKNKDDYSTPTNMFMRDSEDGKKGEGIILKTKIEKFREDMLNLLDSEDKHNIKIGLETNGEYRDADGAPLNWIQYNFFHTILAADITILNKIITEIYNTEFDIVNFLLDDVDAEDFKYDEVDAKVLPKSNYIFLGDDYNAEVIVAAYSTTLNPEVYISQGVDSLPLNKINSAQSIEGEKGKVSISFPAESEGLKKYAGIVRLKSGTGELNDYYFHHEYIVAKQSVTVSASKMNVFYIGVENPVEISAPGIAKDNLVPSINMGTLSKDPLTNNWVVMIDKMPPGKHEVIISVSAEVNGENRNMGEAMFRLKRVPDPIALIANKKEGTINRNILVASESIVPKMPDDFEFDMSYQIVSFKMTLQSGLNIFSDKSNNNRFTEKMISYIKSAKRGQKIWFEEIVARGPDKEDRPLSPIIFTIN